MRSDTERILRQFNQARGAAALVDRFLGFFKALELIYCGHVRGSNPLPCLRKSAELFKIAQGELTPTDGRVDRTMTAQDFEALLCAYAATARICANNQGIHRVIQGYAQRLNPSSPLRRLWQLRRSVGDSRSAVVEQPKHDVTSSRFGTQPRRFG